MKALVTGHRGFVGRHFVPKLTALGYTVTGIDLIEGNDCRDFFKTDTSRFDLVIHLAAIVGGRQTIEHDPLAVASDLAIDSDLFQWAVRTKPGKLVYFSSSAAYPVRLQDGTRKWKLKETDIDLSDVWTPDFTYGWVKLTGELIADYARAQYGLDTLIVRPFSGYAPDQDPSYPFPAFLHRARSHQDPFVVWGDGTQVRDFIHIDDVVDGTLAALRMGIAGPINLGTGVATSFNQLARLMTKEAGYRPALLHRIDQPQGVAYRCADTSKMKTFFTPKITLEQAVHDALNLDVRLPY